MYYTNTTAQQLILKITLLITNIFQEHQLNSWRFPLLSEVVDIYTCK